jgi:hypothetical protein
MHISKVFFVLIALANLIGCAHSIDVSPNNSNIVRESNSTAKINAGVGYFIPLENLNLQVTTPGGGGDRVKYNPYRDMEAGYQTMLTNVFQKVVRVSSADSADEMSRSGVDFVITPDVITNSGSAGLFTWPPTNFSVDLTSTIRNSSGVTIAAPRVLGNGQVAGYSEFRSDFGLAGRRAMEDALIRMQAALLEINFPEQPTQLPSEGPASATSTSSKLEELRKLLEDGLLSQDEYDAARKAIIDSL